MMPPETKIDSTPFSVSTLTSPGLSVLIKGTCIGYTPISPFVAGANTHFASPEYISSVAQTTSTCITAIYDASDAFILTSSIEPVM